MVKACVNILTPGSNRALTGGFFIPMRKHVSDELVKSHALLLRAGLASQIAPGLFFWLPLGTRVLNKIKAIVAKHHDEIGFNMCIAPILQPASLWKQSGRYAEYGPEIMKFKDRQDKGLILGPTAEEVFCSIFAENVTTAKTLPVNLYNIQWKYRDEMRPRFGLMRCREFLMCDAYSFHSTEEETLEFYKLVRAGYEKMFKEIGFNPVSIEQSDTGPIGGSLSHEFFEIAHTGENEIEVEGEKHRGIELGHIFNLGRKYTDSMGISVDGVVPNMGCYGVGVSRLVGAALEVFGEERKINWPAAIAPFQVHILGPNKELGAKLSHVWQGETYWDSQSDFGEGHAIADLIGAPVRIVVGDKKLGSDSITINKREMSETEVIRYLQELKSSKH